MWCILVYSAYKIFKHCRGLQTFKKNYVLVSEKLLGNDYRFRSIIQIILLITMNLKVDTIRQVK